SRLFPQRAPVPGGRQSEGTTERCGEVAVAAEAQIQRQRGEVIGVGQLHQGPRQAQLGGGGVEGDALHCAGGVGEGRARGAPGARVSASLGGRLSGAPRTSVVRRPSRGGERSARTGARPASAARTSESTRSSAARVSSSGELLAQERSWARKLCSAGSSRRLRCRNAARALSAPSPESMSSHSTGAAGVKISSAKPPATGWSRREAPPPGADTGRVAAPPTPPVPAA